MQTQSKKLQAAAPIVPAATVAAVTAASKGPFNLAAMYKVGKPYNARSNTQNGNAALAGVVLQTLAANKGTATGAQLTAAVCAVPNGHYQFVVYMVRRGWLVAA